MERRFEGLDMMHRYSIPVIGNITLLCNKLFACWANPLPFWVMCCMIIETNQTLNKIWCPLNKFGQNRTLLALTIFTVFHKNICNTSTGFSGISSYHKIPTRLLIRYIMQHLTIRGLTSQLCQPSWMKTIAWGQ